MLRKTGSILIAIAFSASVSAQSAIVFTTADTTENPDPNALDFIGLLDPANAGSFQTLFTNTAPDSELSNILQIGADSFLVGNSQFPPNVNQGSIFRFDGLLSGAPTQSTVVGAPLVLSPTGFAISETTGQLLFANNPFGTGIDPNPEDGIFAVNLDGSGLTQVFQEPASPTLPAPIGLTEIRSASFLGENAFLVGAVNGGGGAASDGAISTLSVFEFDADTPTNSSISSISLDSASTGLDFDVTFLSGLTVAADDRVFISDSGTNNLIALTLNDDGSAIDAAEVVANLTDIQTDLGLTLAGISEIEFDPFRNKLVFRQDIFSSLTDTPGIGRISEINLDGTGFNVLIDGVFVEDLTVIPAPASVALLGLGGLFAGRRRRA